MFTRASEALGLLRFARGLPDYVRRTISLDEAKATVRRGMERRADALVELVTRRVFGCPGSPYLKLFAAAGCEFGDFQALVGREGVEGALRALYQSGIHVSFEEFKGLTPAVRGSQRFYFRSTDFDNPRITPHFYGSSGGSRGRPSRIIIDLDYYAQMAPHWAIWFAEHGVLSSPLVFLSPSHPGVVAHHLIAAKFGNGFVQWFATGSGGTATYRLISAYLQRAARRAARFPRPELVAQDKLGRVAAYLAELLSAGARPAVNTSPSMAAQVSLAACEKRLPLRGVTFLLGAEPLTATRKAIIEESGAKATVTYGFSEGGNVGNQCARASRPDEVHVSLDVYAVIGGPPTPDADGFASILMTAFRPACPKVLLNTEIGDLATFDTRECDCAFGELGYVQHLHTIRSSQKLTGGGVTVLTADVQRVLEGILPARFGGGLGDYQLLEQQDAEGLPCYTLMVSPELGPVPEDQLRAVFLDELGQLRRAYGFMMNQWAQRGQPTIMRERPTYTERGKFLPVRSLSRTRT
jgi:hypothetical protein